MYENHYFMSGKNTGSVRVLKGDVIPVVIFVDDKVGKWDARAMGEFRGQFEFALKYLAEEAHKRGISVMFRPSYGKLSIDSDCGGNNCAIWSRVLIANYNNMNMKEFQSKYKTQIKCDEAPVLFAFNKAARSFASTAMSADSGEYSTVFRDPFVKKFEPMTIAHEILHLFGALDLYIPQEVAVLAQQYLPHSIMNQSWEGQIDPLTSYLVGWTDVLEPNARTFLDKTTHLTRSYVMAAVADDVRRSGG